MSFHRDCFAKFTVTLKKISKEWVSLVSDYRRKRLVHRGSTTRYERSEWSAHE